mmetsp:Transcript_85785/g.171714  ORF Transcript_85785/g.171714 Transcript_85785/m.171714 type:complete len:231 (+) Transcript_85785:199-891(+)
MGLLGSYNTIKTPEDEVEYLSDEGSAERTGGAINERSLSCASDPWRPHIQDVRPMASCDSPFVRGAALLAQLARIVKEPRRRHTYVGDSPKELVFSRHCFRTRFRLGSRCIAVKSPAVPEHEVPCFAAHETAGHGFEPGEVRRHTRKISRIGVCSMVGRIHNMFPQHVAKQFCVASVRSGHDAESSRGGVAIKQAQQPLHGMPPPNLCRTLVYVPPPPLRAPVGDHRHLI